MEIPRNYNARLRRYNSTLRMRWSAPTETWVLEKRAAYARADVDTRDMSEDTIAQRRDGYFLLGRFDARALPPVDALIRHLQYTDTHRLGLSADEIADRLEAQERAAEARYEASQRDDEAHAIGDEWESEQWRNGSRVSVPA